MIAINALMCLLFIGVVFYFALIWYTRRKSIFTTNKKDVLIVTAHPDDECMFFSPTILRLQENARLSVLCLSNGNFYGKGALREKELLKSCRILNIPQQNIIVLNNIELQDYPGIIWNEAATGNEILKVLRDRRFAKIITFDRRGVSGHANHIAAYRAIRSLVIKKALPEGTIPYCLETVNIVRKYISLFDLPYSLVSCLFTNKREVFVSTPAQIWKAQRAMIAHWSQLEWFRILYIIFSRYMVINTLKVIQADSPT